VNEPGQQARREALLRELGDGIASLADALLDRGVELEEAVAAFEARYVRTAVARHSGNLSQAAEALGIHRNTLRSKLQRNGGRSARIS
jgi:DNA-binding NtrC family response regulator